MGLASPLLALKALPLAWFEVVVACAIASWLQERDQIPNAIGTKSLS
jgi:hypothetical protein